MTAKKHFANKSANGTSRRLSGGVRLPSSFPQVRQQSFGLGGRARAVNSLENNE